MHNSYGIVKIIIKHIKDKQMSFTILLLEDDIQLSDTVKQFLELNNYRVLCAYDGLQAQDIAYETHIDMMLLDVKVPNLNGFDFLKKIRSENKDIPVILVTSLNSTKDVEQGFTYGCDDYIRKPFSLKELLFRINSLFRRAYSASDERVMISNNIIFDMKEMTLTKDNQKIPLKAKELKLLSLFLQHPDEMLEYKRIFESLWGYNEEYSHGSLRAYIRSLRSILGKEYIETNKNMGYRFVKQ